MWNYEIKACCTLNNKSWFVIILCPILILILLEAHRSTMKWYMNIVIIQCLGIFHSTAVLHTDSDCVSQLNIEYKMIQDSPFSISEVRISVCRRCYFSVFSTGDTRSAPACHIFKPLWLWQFIISLSADSMTGPIWANQCSDLWPVDRKREVDRYNMLLSAVLYTHRLIVMWHVIFP